MSGRRSAEAGLKNVQAQVERQCKLLRQKDEDLYKAQQEILGLKKELSQVEEAACTVRETAEAATKASYNEGVEET